MTAPGMRLLLNARKTCHILPPFTHLQSLTMVPGAKLAGECPAAGRLNDGIRTWQGWGDCL
jgi:hypothetical protein